MTHRRLSDAQIAAALRAHLPASAMAGLRGRISEVAESTSQQRPLPSFLGAFSEEWLSMSALTSLSGATGRFPWRAVAFLALLILALAAGALIVAGTLPRVPKPFGPAVNGLVIFSSGGDIYAGDPVTGATRAIVTGPGWDIDPRWSRDGTRFLFERYGDNAVSRGDGSLYVARADGSDLTLITQEPRWDIADAAFSPDGEQILFTSELPRTISIAPADGSGPIRTLDLGVPVSSASYRPPDGAEIAALVGEAAIYVVSADDGDVRRVMGLEPEFSIGQPAWSPDGSRVSYIRWDPVESALTAQIQIVSADGRERYALPMGPGSMWEAEPSWSNDGTRLAIARGYSPDNEWVVAAIVPVPGGGRGVETDSSLRVLGACCLAGPFEWAPDDSSIIFAPTDTTGSNSQQTLIDPGTGRGRLAPWAATSGPSWQRRAP
jgi:hypothetical protein